MNIPEDKKPYVFVAIFLLISLFIEIYSTNYTDSIYVQTVSHTYEVNYHKRKRKVKKEVKFTDTVCYDLTDFFDNKLKKDGNPTGRLKVYECEKFLAENNISSDKSIRKIIELCSNFNTDFSEMKIFVTDGKYYFMNELKIETLTLFDLYMYDIEKDKLSILYRFENEDILKVTVKK